MYVYSKIGKENLLQVSPELLGKGNPKIIYQILVEKAWCKDIARFFKSFTKYVSWYVPCIKMLETAAVV